MFQTCKVSNWTLCESKWSEWHKLDPDVRNVDTYSLFHKNLLAFIRSIENSIYSVYDPLGIKILHRLRILHSILFVFQMHNAIIGKKIPKMAKICF